MPLVLQRGARHPFSFQHAAGIASKLVFCMCHACMPYSIICSPLPHPRSPTSKSPSSPSKPPEPLLLNPPPPPPHPLLFVAITRRHAYGDAIHVGHATHTAEVRAATSCGDAASYTQHFLFFNSIFYVFIQLMHADKCIITANILQAERAHRSEC